MSENQTPKWTPDIPVVPGWYWMRELYSGVLPYRAYRSPVLVRVRIVHEQADTFAEYYDPAGYEWRRQKHKRWLRAPQALWWPTQVIQPPEDLHLGVDDGNSEPGPPSSRPMSPSSIIAMLKGAGGQQP